MQNTIILFKKLNIINACLLSDNVLKEQLVVFVDELCTDSNYKDILNKLKENIDKEKFLDAFNLVIEMKRMIRDQIFNRNCSQFWNSLISTEFENVRFCSRCGKNVFKISSIEEFEKRLSLEQCVFFPPDTEADNFWPKNPEYVFTFYSKDRRSCLLVKSDETWF